MKNFQLFFISLLCICIFSCGKEDFKERERNPNIVALEQSGTNAIWLTDSTICIMPLSVAALDENLKSVQYKKLGNETGFLHSYNKGKDKMLYTRNGSLYEYDFSTDCVDAIFDNADITSALYYRNNKILYCSSNLDSAGYIIEANLYMYDLSTKENNFIRTITSYSTFNNPNYVNGFDIHPKQNKLLLYEYGAIVEYDMDSKQTERIYVLPCISTWFRYNPEGNKIVYTTPNGIELLDLSTMKNKVLDANIAIYKNDISNGIYPCWSPNGENIICGSKYSQDDNSGPFKLFILKNVE